MISSLILRSRFDLLASEINHDSPVVSLWESDSGRGRIVLAKTRVDSFSPRITFRESGDRIQIFVVTPIWKILLSYGALLAVEVFGFKSDGVDPIFIWVSGGIYVLFVYTHRRFVMLLEKSFRSNHVEENEDDE
jgi:hypothetical protein